MKRKLLATIGCDAENNLVPINEALKGEHYSCPQCGQRIVPRNSGKMGKGSKRPHFAHVKKSKFKCSGESILRHLFKTRVIHLLQERLEYHQPFLIEWGCNYCSKKYSKNLLQQATFLSMDFSIGECTPDITILDKDGHPIIAIELVIRGKLTKKILQQYEESGIILVQIRLTEDDVFEVEKKLHRPDDVGFCSNDECYNTQFHHRAIRRTLFLQSLKCKTCGEEVDGYMVRTYSAFGPIKLDNLTEEEKQIVLNKYFRGKKVTVADFVIYGKCKCVPYSKNLQYVKKADNAYMQSGKQGKIMKKR